MNVCSKSFTVIYNLQKKYDPLGNDLSIIIKTTDFHQGLQQFSNLPCKKIGFMSLPELISNPSYSLTVIRSFPLPIKQGLLIKEKSLKPKKTNQTDTPIPSHVTNTVRFNEYTLYL